jgi:hypothetical protein
VSHHWDCIKADFRVAGMLEKLGLQKKQSMVDCRITLSLEMTSDEGTGNDYEPI